MHQVTWKNILESIKNGIHVEFKLSTENDETKQKRIKKKILFEMIIYFF